MSGSAVRVRSSALSFVASEMHGTLWRLSSFFNPRAGISVHPACCGLRISCRDRGEGQGGCAYGDLPHSGCRLLGGQLRGDEVRRRVLPPAPGRGVPLLRGRATALLRPPPPRAAEQAEAWRHTPYAGVGLLRRGRG